MARKQKLSKSEIDLRMAIAMANDRAVPASNLRAFAPSMGVDRDAFVEACRTMPGPWHGFAYRYARNLQDA